MAVSASTAGLMAVVLLAAACSAGSDVVAEPSVVESVPAVEGPSVEETPVDVTLDSVEIGGDVNTFAPAGWSVAVDGSATPPDASGFTGAVGWRIDDRCPDGCEERSGAEWSDLVTSTDIDPLLAQDQVTVVRDESTVGRRLIEVVSEGGFVTVLILRWVDGASAYLRCDLAGDKSELGDLIAAFEFACDNTRAALTGSADG